MTASEKLAALYEQDKDELCPCRGYPNRDWYDHLGFPEIVAVVQAAEFVVNEREREAVTKKTGVHGPRHIYPWPMRSPLTAALAALDAKLADA